MGSVKMKDKSKNLTEQTYQSIRNAILTGKLKPREAITIVGLAQKLDISRTPVKNVLNQLLIEELIVHDSGNYYVSDIFSGDLEEIYLMRSALEGLAVRFTCQNISKEEIDELYKLIESYEQAKTELNDNKVIEINAQFHLTLSKISGKRRLHKEIKKLYEYCTRYRILSLSSPSKVVHSKEGHYKIIKALEKGDPDHAEMVMREHLNKGPDYIYDALEKLENNDISISF